MKTRTKILLALSTAAGLGLGVTPALAGPGLPPIRVQADEPVPGQDLIELFDGVDHHTVRTVDELLGDDTCVYVHLYVINDPTEPEREGYYVRKCPAIMIWGGS